MLTQMPLVTWPTSTVSAEQTVVRVKRSTLGNAIVLVLATRRSTSHFRISIIMPLVDGLVVVVHNFGHTYLETVLFLYICLMHKTITAPTQW